MSNKLKIKKIDMVLTEEVKKRLVDAGLLGFDVDADFPYVPKAYRKKEDGEFLIPKEFWPVFTIRGLDGVQSAKIEDGLKGEYSYKKGKDGKDDNEVSVSINSGKSRLETLLLGLRTWRNFINDNFEEILPPTTGQVVEGHLKHFKHTLQIELASAIDMRTTLNEEELQGLE